MRVLIASVVVFVAGVLLLWWQFRWQPRREWRQLEPTFIEWVKVAVDNHRAGSPTAEQIEDMTAVVTNSFVPDRVNRP